MSHPLALATGSRPIPECDPTCPHLRQVRVHTSSSARRSELFEGGDGAFGASSASAARLLAKARADYRLDDGSESYLGSQERGSRSAGLHITQAWPQRVERGGAMPTSYGEPASWGQGNDYYYPEASEDWSRESSPDGQTMSVGVVDGGDKEYPDGWGDDGGSEMRAAPSSSSNSPFYWFLKGGAAPWGGSRREEEGYPESVRDPVKKLIAIKRQRDRLDRMQDETASRIYDSAAGGGMGGFVPGTGEERSFIGGFLQGAVEASRRSVEQQGEFARELEAQSHLVSSLETIVGELQEEMRKQNWKKTEESVHAKDAASAPAPVMEEAAPSFNVEFYMEAECPACKSMATDVLPAVLNAFGDMVNLTTVPFGNAAVINGTIFCQHGEAECLGNKIELCLMDRYPKWQSWYPAFKCIEKSYDSPENASKVCLPKHGVDLADVMGCAKGDEGELLHLKAAKRTLGLVPPHKWTPWIVLDGKPLGEKINSLLRVICEKLPKTRSHPEKNPSSNPEP